MRALVLACALLMSSAPAWADDCPLDLGRGTGWIVYSTHYMLSFRPDPPHIEAGQPFTLILNVCTRNGEPGELVTIEAELSETSKKMLTKPLIVPGRDGRFRAEDMLLSEPGRWDVTFVVRAGEETERLSHELIVK